MKNRILNEGNRSLWATGALLIALSSPSHGAFSSGSTGADGALNITATGVTVFNPKAMGLDPDSDNVFQFTTINIGPSSSLKMTADVMGSRPVIFLASGNVTISGTIDLNGEAGHSYSGVHRTSIAGAGGYGGGIGVLPGLTVATMGEGPGGGGVGNGNSGNCNVGASAGHRTAGPVLACSGTCCPQAGKTYDNQYLLPLQGGSGGSGTFYENGSAGGGGGAGGGAILIASSGTITMNGSISARGGIGGQGQNNFSAGAGSGGDVRLVANSINGLGSIDVGGGCCGTLNGANGYIRVESYATTLSSLNLHPFGIVATPGLPLYPPPGTLPAVRILSIDGVAVPSNPTATYTVPDVVINRGDSCNILIQANNVPTGTIVHLVMTSEDMGSFTLDSAPLTGSLGSSTAIARTKIPTGYSRFTLNANW